ncbi:MAG: DUF503 domain-containing protein [Spirochaetota bacterium]
MVVALAVFTVRIPHAASLKDKRHVVRPLIERLRREHAFAASEVEFMDEHTRARIGLAGVGNDAQVLRGAVDKCFYALEEDYPNTITDTDVEMMTFHGGE